MQTYITIAGLIEQRKQLPADIQKYENCTLRFEINGQEYHVELVQQKTGFGKKNFFKCPMCGARRTKL